MASQKTPSEHHGAGTDCMITVASTLQLGAAARTGYLENANYLIVHNADDVMIGIVDTNYIQQLLTTGTPQERSCWEKLTLESALRWRLTKSTENHDSLDSPEDLDESQPVTLINDTDGVTAIARRGELFINWKRVSTALVDATTDAVTNLPNRRAFERRLEEEMVRAKELKHSVSVVLIDVDNFKSVNDMYGHSVGDDVLKRIADTMLGLIRSYDLLVRYGGDEFAAICFGCGKNEVDVPLERIQQNFKTKFSQCAVALPPISLTIGAAVAHDASLFESAQDLVELADVALYQGKEAGRDCTWKIEVSNRKDLVAAPTEVSVKKARDPSAMPLLTTATNDPLPAFGAARASDLK